MQSPPFFIKTIKKKQKKSFQSQKKKKETLQSIMDSPFFRKHWSDFAPRRQIVREVPVHRPAKPSSKVVSIPVHFVGSEQSRSESALKIQKVFRGFLVRKSMKKIAAIKGEVDEIDRRISQNETIELIRKDAKERLRVNETLMNLLFRLDSVKGVDSGVRVCRKTVIKKAIALQERVDSIVAGDQTLGDDQAMETKDGDHNGDKVADYIPESEPKDPEIDPNPESFATLGDDQAMETKDEEDNGDNAADYTPESEPKYPEVDPNPESFADCSDSSEIDLDQTLGKEGKAREIKEEADEEAVMKANEDKEAFEDKRESNGDDTLSQSGSSVDPQKEEEDDDEMEIVQAEKEEGTIEENSNSKAKEGDNKKKKELLERMIEENEKMMSLLADLYEKNEVQTRLLSSLSKRVEQLEKAFVCDKLRKKKKRRAAASATVGSVDSLEKCPDANATKKSEKR